MALFRRKKEESVLPEEVNEYYQSQRRERTGTAIVLGIIALIVTLLIGLALFFGGRWAYNQIIGNDDNTSQTENGSSNDGTISDEGVTFEGDGGNSSNVSGGSSGSSTDATSDDASNDDFSSIDLDGGEGSVTTQPGTGDNSAMPSTGDEPAVLPATGDPGR